MLPEAWGTAKSILLQAGQRVRGWERQRLAALVVLAAVAATTVWALGSGYRLGPRVVVHQPVPVVKLAEPVPLEKPSGSSTVPSDRENTFGPAAPADQVSQDPALVWPVRGEVVRGFGYGFEERYHDYRFHSGVDVAAPSGTAVKAAMAGRVREVAYDAEHQWRVVVDDGSGWETVYQGLGRLTGALAGTAVEAGAVLGYIGEPGAGAHTSVPHLHFELRRNGEAKNPLDYLP
jgi:murein DD-endopeptidase MepM/ murein hydrolase activator NlpD